MGFNAMALMLYWACLGPSRPAGVRLTKTASPSNHVLKQRNKIQHTSPLLKYSYKNVFFSADYR